MIKYIHCKKHTCNLSHINHYHAVCIHPEPVFILCSKKQCSIFVTNSLLNGLYLSILCFNLSLEVY